MAIINGPYASKTRGKFGEVVAVKTTGNRTALRSYQPKVKNPNTLRQRVSRAKLAEASAVAAALANGVKAGYGLAVSGTKMYPRNMFLRDLVKGNVMEVDPTDLSYIAMDYSEMKVSARVGISMAPTVGTLGLSTAGKISVPVTAYPTVEVDKPGQMGIVIVCYFPNKEASVVKMAAMPTTGTSTIDVDGLAAFQGETVHVYAFAKWIPETGNEVQTTTEPWKYPSETSDSVYVGTGNVA